MLDDAEIELDRHQADPPDPGWLTVFDRAGLAGHRGSCMLDLGQPARAVERLAQQDAAAPELFVRSRVLWLLDRATAWLRLKEVEAACAAINQALDLGGERPSPRVRHRFLAATMPLRAMSGLPEVNELQDRIRIRTPFVEA